MKKSRKKATGNILASIRSSNMGGSMLDGSLACLNAFFFGLKAGFHTTILVAE